MAQREILTTNTMFTERHTWLVSRVSKIESMGEMEVIEKVLLGILLYCRAITTMANLTGAFIEPWGRSFGGGLDRQLPLRDRCRHLADRIGVPFLTIRCQYRYVMVLLHLLHVLQHTHIPMPMNLFEPSRRPKPEIKTTILLNHRQIQILHLKTVHHLRPPP